MTNGKTNKPDGGTGGELETQTILCDIRALIEEARASVATVVNAGMTLLHWQIGHRMRTEILKEERAAYGKGIVASLSRQLTAEYGAGWSEKHLRHCLRFAETFPDEQIVSAVRRQLSWTHIKSLMYIDDELKREFYTEICKLESWSTRTLQKRINSMLYERTVISKKPEETIKSELEQLRDEHRLSPDLVFKDPYFLDFLGLSDRYFEKDLEDAILRELEQFLLEMGTGFAFMARQKRIQIDNDDYYIDLLFFHRNLNRLIAIDLKLGEFKAEYKGQMELYLRWLKKYECHQEENEPLGIILCAGKKQELIELLELKQSGIHVAEYLTGLPSRELLEKKLHKAVEKAKARLMESPRGEELK